MKDETFTNEDVKILQEYGLKFDALFAIILIYLS